MVYRALAGIDSIVQAAGRCNREGKLRDESGNAALGKVVVFVPPKPPSSQVPALRDAYQTTIGVFSSLGEKALTREGFQSYFEQMYRSVDFKRHDVIEALTPDTLDGAEVSFRHAAALFKIIDEAGQMPLIVRYGDEVENLINTLTSKGPERWLMRKLQRYTVNSFEPVIREWLRVGDIKEVRPGIYVQSSEWLYDENRGLMSGNNAQPAAHVLVI